MKTYEAFYNENTGQYEMHKPGCAHGKRKFMYGGWPEQGNDASEACANYNRYNEGCFATPAPCTKRY